MILRRQIPTERDLVALADGSLPAARRVKVERAVAASPELQAIVSSQRRALAAIDHAAAERAPHALRARLALQADPRPRRRAPRPALLRFGPAGGLAAAVVAVAIVLALGGGIQAPTVAQAAILATRTPVVAAPAQNDHTATLSGVSGAGLPFPYWHDWFGFRAVGVRYDRFGGRRATTVFYRRGDMTVAYTIFAGKPLAFGAATHGTVKSGVAVWTMSAHGMHVATWLRRGHTCVLSGRGVPAGLLVRLGSWRADGKIPY